MKKKQSEEIPGIENTENRRRPWKQTRNYILDVTHFCLLIRNNLHWQAFLYQNVDLLLQNNLHFKRDERYRVFGRAREKRKLNDDAVS